MAALDFPNTPSPDQIFVNWKWDGVKWTNPPGTGIIGVTDGSNAPPGYVGEYMSIIGEVNPTTSGTGVTAATLNLTPGDWDVGGWAYVGGTFGSTSQAAIEFTAAIDQSPSVPGGFMQVHVDTIMYPPVAPSLSAYQMIPLPTIRISSANPTPVNIIVGFFNSSGGTFSPSTAFGFLWARRAR